MANPPSPARLVSLDQFRGYTVLGMFLVNFLGGFVVVPAVFQHHNTYCSYADTIMPQFFFAVGFAARLTWLRRKERDGLPATVWHFVKRNLALLLLAVILYHLDGSVQKWADLKQLGPWGVLVQGFQREPFQTLGHIGLAGLWTLPVLGAGVAPRVLFLLGSAALHLGLSHAFYYDWVWHRPGIDGGPLGFLTWTIPVLVGSFAFDAVQARPDGQGAGKLLCWGLGLMLLGYALSCLNCVTPPNAQSDTPGLTTFLVEPPFVPPTRQFNLWTMSQRAGSVSYLVFATGFALAVYAGFRAACDRKGWKLAYFDLLGQNALAGYLIHLAVMEAVLNYVPKDSPTWYVLAALALFLAITTLCLRFLQKHRLYLRL